MSLLLQGLKQTVPARITAVGFIAVMIFGNLWLARAMLGVEPLGWIVYGFLGGLVTAAVGGLGLAALAVRAMLGPKDAADESDDAGRSAPL